MILIVKRKIANTLALAVLGLLQERPMHPYEMASVLRERGKDQDMPIKWGSLYTVVANLEKHGLVAATGSVRQGGRPERTVYAITDAGRAELTDWVRELLADPERRSALAAAGYARAQEFTWEASAAAHVASYEKAAAQAAKL